MGESQSLFITLKGYKRCIRQDALLCFFRNTQVLPRANKKKAVVLHDLMSFVKKRSIKDSLHRNLAETFPTSPVSSTPEEPSLASSPVPLTPEAASLDHEPRELCPSPVLLPSPSPMLPLSQMPATPEDSSLGCSPVPMTPEAATLPVGAVPLNPGVVSLPSPVSAVLPCTPQTAWSPDNAVSPHPRRILFPMVNRSFVIWVVRWIYLERNVPISSDMIRFLSLCLLLLTNSRCPAMRIIGDTGYLMRILHLWELWIHRPTSFGIGNAEHTSVSLLWLW